MRIIRLSNNYSHYAPMNWMALFTGGASSEFLFEFKTLHVPANLEIKCQLFVGVVVTICVESSKVIPREQHDGPRKTVDRLLAIDVIVVVVRCWCQPPGLVNCDANIARNSRCWW